MKNALPLRDYQRAALDAAAEHEAQRVALVLPTGGGKTVCFAHQSVEHLELNPDDRVLVLVHTDELVFQAAKKISKVAPHLSVGIVKAAKDEVYADVIVASVQTLRNPKRRARIERVSLVIVDECHHATAATYMEILRHFGCFGGGTRAIGYTATLVRGDGKSLGHVWEAVAFQRDISWMVRRRYLIPPRGVAVEVPDLDLSSVRSTRTDYRDGDLGEALADSLAPELVAKAILEHAPNRKGVLFAPTVAAAELFAKAMNAAGIPTGTVHGAMPLGDEHHPEPGTRRYVLAEHAAGRLRWITNCMVLTEGYDDPSIDCIVPRLTKSKGLYQQMVGRGLRVDPERPYEEQDCLILDVAGAARQHDLCSLVDLSERKLDPKDAHSGRTLTELEDELDDLGGVEMDGPAWYVGDTTSREFDPLGRPSTAVWLKTKGGTFFLPAGRDAFVFIMQYPAPGQWSVAWCSKTNSVRFKLVDGAPRVGFGTDARPVGMTEHRGLPLDQALVWASDLAVDMGADGLQTAARKAPWRKKPASEKMKNLAKAVGIKTDAPMTAGALSDLITTVTGSRRIDPIVNAVRSRHG